jgi:hypothetical protein
MNRFKKIWHSFWYERINTNREFIAGGEPRPTFYTFRSQRLINIVCGTILLIIILHII